MQKIVGFGISDLSIPVIPTDIWPNFERQFYMPGAEFTPTTCAYFYAEYLFANSTDSLVTNESNVFPWAFA
ncbi:MAG: hypothetical protein WBM56_09290 [Robiginitalea sp.]|uniref:hypothetical protein n=1 Tax=Robiginitalea sp. TaxID=1902411 RepID=UPI003C78E4A9